jgi:heptosyltransferase III
MNLGRTLVIRPGALGDAVVTIPALHALRFAGAESLTLLGTPSSWSFMRTAHQGLRVRDFGASDWLGLFASGAKLGESARAALEKISTAIVYLDDSAEIERALKSMGVKTVISASPPKINAREDTTAGRHASIVLLDALTTLTNETQREDALKILEAQDDVFLKLDEQEKLHAMSRLGYDAPPDGGFVSIHPGSGGKTKCWPATSYARLAVALACTHGFTPIVFFGPADDKTREEFEAAMPPGVVWEAAAHFPLRDVFALMSQSKFFVGNDSGMSHLAARVCPTLAIFGPTDSAVWSPFGADARVLQASQAKLEKLSVDDVMAQLSDFMKGNE